MIAAVLLLAQSQTVSWATEGDPYELAGHKQKLVMVYEHVYNPLLSTEGEQFFSKPAVVQASGKFVPARGGYLMSTIAADQDGGPGCPVRFYDKDRNLRGLAFVPMDPGLFVQWTDAIQSAWKKHDALSFRSKGRLNDQDMARFAFSLAMRGQTDEASAWIAAIPAGHRVDEADFALMGLAMAYADKRKFGRSIDNWLKLESSTQSPVLKSAGRLGCGAAMEADRPKEAWAKFKKVANSGDSPASDRWWADFFLKRLKGRGIDGG